MSTETYLVPVPEAVVVGEEVVFGLSTEVQGPSGIRIGPSAGNTAIAISQDACPSAPALPEGGGTEYGNPSGRGGSLYVRGCAVGTTEILIYHGAILLQSHPVRVVERTLVVLSDGTRGELVLGWSDATAGALTATGWEYRKRPWSFVHGRPSFFRERTWEPWTAIPGDGSIRRHRVTGLEDDVPYDFEVRPLAPSGSGIGSNIGVGVPPHVGTDGIARLNVPYLTADRSRDGGGNEGQIVEGGRTYRLGDSEMVITIPEGLSITNTTVALDMLAGDIFDLTDAETGNWVVLDFRFREVRRSVDSDGATPDPNDLFDQMVASIRRQPEPTTLRYDTYDLTGAVEAPGSYAFLADADDPSTAVTTYEGLRDGTATALLIHTTDADGVPRADVYDAVGAGDFVEWRQADDCWVRYVVTSLPTAASGTAARTFKVRAFTDSYAGCNGTILADRVRSISWAPPAISSRALTAPVRHGAYHLIPAGWTGPVADSAIAPVPDDIAAVRDHRGSPHPFWRPATVPEGWSLAGVTWGGETDPPYGYSAWYQNEHGETGVEILVGYWGGEQYPYPLLVFRDTTWERELRIIDGHHAIVQYSPLGPRHEPRRLPRVELFNADTRMFYLVIAWDARLAGADPTATIEIARSLIPTPSGPVEPATALRYDTYDLTGAVETPGSYAFLADADDLATAVTTYEGLRDGTATALLIHTTDADGVSRADVYDAVVVGDLFEWRQADDCFVRYTVTEVKPDPSGTAPRKLLVVQWTIYAFTGCGESIASGPVSIIWGPQPALGGDTLTVPVMVGIHQLVPENWTGAVRDVAHEAAPGGSHLIQQAYPSTAVLSAIDYWREPEIPEGWSLAYISAGTSSDPYQGFSATYSPTEGSGTSLEFHGYFLSHRNWQVPAGSTSSGVVAEAWVIAGRPALIEYSPPGDSNDAYLPTTISIMDLATESGYTLTAYDSTLKNIDTLVAIASSLFAEPTAAGA